METHAGQLGTRVDPTGQHVGRVATHIYHQMVRGLYDGLVMDVGQIVKHADLVVKNVDLPLKHVGQMAKYVDQVKNVCQKGHSY